VRKIIQNAVEWCYNPNKRPYMDAPKIATTLEDIRLNGAEGEYLEHR
jgi:trehalose utilization protein